MSLWFDPALSCDAENRRVALHQIRKAKTHAKARNGAKQAKAT